MLAVIDTETTGLVAGRNEIIQLAVIIVDEETMNFKDKFVTLIKPMHESNISQEALKVNRITMEDLDKAPTPLQVRNAFYQWHDEMYDGEKITPLGHNFNFDERFLKHFFGDEMYNERFGYHTEDTLNSAKFLRRAGKIPKGISLSLSSLCDYYNIPIKAHDALGDVFATLHLYKKLLEVING